MKKTNEFGCAEWIVIIIVACAINMLLAWPIMAIWNALIPVLFGGPTVTYWQMLGLWILCGALFKSNDLIKSIFE